MASQFCLFKTRRFLPIFITQFLGTLNANIFKNALIIRMTYHAIDKFHGQISATIAAGIFVLPFFLFSAIGGELADKFEKSQLIKIIKLFEIGLMLFASIALYCQYDMLAFFILFLVGVQSTFFGPVKYAILPCSLQDNELVAGNGLIEAGTFISILLGVMIGSLFILTHFGSVYISLFLCAIAICGYWSSCYIPKTEVPPSDRVIHYNFIAETYRTIQYTWRQKEIFSYIMAISWFWLMGATFLAELPAYVKNELHADPNVVVFIVLTFSIGIALGSMLCNKLLNGNIHTRYVPFASLGMALTAIDLYFGAQHIAFIPGNALLSIGAFLQTFTGWRIILDLLLNAICGGLYTVPLYTMLQHRSVSSHRARVIASNNVMNALFMVLSATSTLSMLKMGLTVSQVFLVLGIGTAITTLALFKSLLTNLAKRLYQAINRSGSE